MAQFGHFTLWFAWLLALIGIVSGAYSGITKKRNWFFVARNATILAGVSSLLSLFALGASFINNDYSLQYVWQFSNAEMEPLYRVSAIWGGMDGSMLLWAAILAFMGLLVGINSKNEPRTLMPWVLSVFNSTSFFFLTVVACLTNPFRYIKADFIPLQGNGLNPLLQNPLMIIHPPMLYVGFTTFAVPFAYCLGALFSGQISNEWIRLTKRWTLVAWTFLTAGIILGGHWAYVELGWGGFWAWDPVENASFFPWLTGTAFLHSVMVQERKQMLKVWNIWLIVLTYALTVFGTFLTRSGIVQSVHAFAETDVGWVFMVELSLIFIMALALTIYRWKDLRSERQIESYFSREAAFLFNNLALLSICFATIWGVMFPVLSEYVTGQKQTVGPPFFNQVNVPLFLFLVFLMGVGPLIAWRKASFTSMRKMFLKPFVSALVVCGILVWAGITQFWAITSYGICFFVLVTIFGEFHRGAKALRANQPSRTYSSGFFALFSRHKSRYGGYVVHLGVLIATLGITASMAHKVEREFSLAVGEEYQVGRFILKLSNFDTNQNKNYQSYIALFSVYDASDRSMLGIMAPEKRVYIKSGEPTSEVALRTGLREDLYLVFAGIDEQANKGVFKVFINPLQIWLWFGSIMMLIGSIIILIPAPRTVIQELPDSSSVRI